MTAHELAGLTDNFVARYTGVRIDVDNSFGAQCWDLAHRFGVDVVGCPALPTRPGGNGGAIDCFRYYLSPLPAYYQRYALNETTPRKGDLIIWSESLGGGAGHVGIFLAAYPGGFISFDQNWPSGSAPKMVSHNWHYVVGFLRPRTQEEDVVHDLDNEFGRWQKLATQIRGRTLSRTEFRGGAVGHTWLKAMEILSDNAEADKAMEAQNVGQVALRDNWPGHMQNLEAQLGALQAQVEELKKNPTREAYNKLLADVEAANKASKEASEAVAPSQTISPPQAQNEAQAEPQKPNLLIRLLSIFAKSK